MGLPEHLFSWVGILVWFHLSQCFFSFSLSSRFFDNHPCAPVVTIVQLLWLFLFVKGVISPVPPYCGHLSPIISLLSCLFTLFDYIGLSLGRKGISATLAKAHRPLTRSLILLATDSVLPLQQGWHWRHPPNIMHNPVCLSTQSQIPPQLHNTN